MSQETKTCQNCKQNFTIEPEDFTFYERIQVPPPTWCPECRMIRRMSFRNERTWYRRKCDATGKDILSMFAPDKSYKVYAQDYWRSDAWDPLEYGRKYDFSKPFFEQFASLFREIPHSNLVQKNIINSDYSNYALNLKNCYLVIGCDGAEDSAYIMGATLNAKNCLDVHQSKNVEFCYEIVDCSKSSRLLFSQNCEGCSDSAFLYDCKNCSNCFGCVGLRNKQYFIFNQPYSKDGYANEIRNLDIGSYQILLNSQRKFEALKLTIPHKYAIITKSVNVIGDDITNSRNCRYCFNVRDDVENCRYSFRVHNQSRDGQDAMIAWNSAELFYEVMSINGQRVKFSALIWGGFDIQYSYYCFDCNNLFGCVGLKNKSYCILNKQYSKEEYEVLLPKIVEQMKTMPYMGQKDRIYHYGEFFPLEISPFAYNETFAQDYFPLNKDEALERDYSWRDYEKRNYQINLKSEELPDHIKDVKDDILGKNIQCAHNQTCNEQCTQAFKIIKEELQFYRKMNLSLPRLCPNCRHYQRLKQRNPLKLWHRQCMCDYKVYKNTAKHSHHPEGRCPNEFETSYAPDRPEIVYCEQCYNVEVV